MQTGWDGGGGCCRDILYIWNYMVQERRGLDDRHSAVRLQDRLWCRLFDLSACVPQSCETDLDGSDQFYIFLAAAGYAERVYKIFCCGQSGGGGASGRRGADPSAFGTVCYRAETKRGKADIETADTGGAACGAAEKRTGHVSCAWYPHAADFCDRVSESAGGGGRAAGKTESGLCAYFSGEGLPSGKDDQWIFWDYKI